MKKTILLLMMCMANGCTSNYVIDDPYQSTNLKLYKQYKAADNNIWKPTSTVYKKKVGPETRQRVKTFFANLSGIQYFINNLLQGKVIKAAKQISRFILNTLFGLFGFFDVAQHFDLKGDYPEDFAQTLAVWGYKSSNYLIVPLIGPTTQRGAIGFFVDFFAFNLIGNANFPFALRSTFTIGNAINLRTEADQAISFVDSAGVEPYSFLKTIWSENRYLEFNDGIAINTHNQELEDELEDIFDEE